MSRAGSVGKVKSDDEIKNFGVAWLWDFENMWLENTDHPSLDQLRENVDKALKTLNPLYFLHGKPIGYGKVKKSNKAAVKYLRKKDFTFYNEKTRTVHCSTCGVMMRQSSIYPNDDPHERKTDIADISLVKEAIFHAMDSITNEKVPRNILLVSNDKDFKCTLEALKLRGFTVMAAIEAKTPNHMYADICGNGTWCWKEMEKGGKHISKSIMK